jgi:YVTN family beta-propeller protein
MNRRKILKFTLLLVAVNLVGCGDDYCHMGDYTRLKKGELKIVALYSDPMNERTVVIDVDKMEFIDEIYSNGKNTYNIDILDRYNTYNKVYTMTRGSNSVDVIDIEKMENIKTIELEHYPRSGVYNPILKLMLVSGKDKAMSSLIDIDSDEVVLVVGENRKTDPKDYGGSSATGHPCWVSANQFLMLDRAKREIQLFKLSYDYDKWSATLQDSIKTSTSVHHVIREGIYDSDVGGLGDFEFRLENNLYGVTEGSFDENIAPSIIKFKLENDKLVLKDEMSIGFDENIEKGIHHILFHPKQNILYIPSKEGVLYVADYKKMKIISTIKTGKGSGHIKFAPERDLAVVTNHNDKFVTIIDTKKNVKIKDVVVSEDAINGEILQSHTQYIDENYFYAFATDNGKFYELSLDTLEITRTLYTGGTPKQGGVLFTMKDSN